MLSCTFINIHSQMSDTGPGGPLVLFSNDIIQLLTSMR